MKLKSTLLFLCTLAFAFTIPVIAAPTAANVVADEGASFSFGSTRANTPVTYTFTLRNTGQSQANRLDRSTVVGSPFAFVGGSYPGTGGTCGNDLNGGASCTVRVVFSPTLEGSYSGTLNLKWGIGWATTESPVALTGTATSPAILSFTQGSSYNFGAVALDGTSEVTLNLQNTGSDTATGISGSLISPFFSYFGGSYPGTGGTCSASLAGSQSCTMVLSFAPITMGSKSHTFTINYVDGVNAASFSMALSGSGSNAALLTLSDSPSYNFGAIDLGITLDRTFTLTNTGGRNATAIAASSLGTQFRYKDGNYPGTGGTCSTSLAKNGGTCTIVVTFAPTQGGAANATLTVAYDNGTGSDTVSVALTGTGIGPAVLGWSVGSQFMFPVTLVGSSSEATLTVSNSGMKPAQSIAMSISSPVMGFVGGAYPGIGGTCGGSLAVGASCQVRVVFTPTHSDGFAYELDYSYYDGYTTRASEVTLLGPGKNPAVVIITAGPSYTLNSVLPTHTSEDLLTLANLGQASATSLSSTALSGAFSFIGGSYPGTGGTCGSTLPIGSTCSIRISFTPPSSGSFSQSVTISYHDGVAAKQVSTILQGSSTTPATVSISHSPSYSFGNTQIGAALAQGFVLTNSGGVPATSISASGLSAPFSITGGTCSSVLPAGSSCEVIVSFSPTSGGNFSDTMDVSYNDGVQSQLATRSMSGSANGPAVVVSLDGSNIAFGSVSVNTSFSKTITIKNNGATSASGMGGSISSPFSFAGGSYPGTGGTCSTSLLAGATCTIGLSYSPTQAGSDSGNFTLSYFNGSATVSLLFALTGSGTAATIGLDVTFNGTGFVRTTVGSGQANTKALALQPDGKIVVAGYLSTGALNDAMLVRYEVDGTLDASFGTAGIVTTSLGMSDARFSAVTVQPDGKIVAVGAASNGGAKDILIARFLANGSLDTAFSGDGISLTDIAGGNDEAFAVTLQTDGKVVIAGYTFMEGDEDFAILRYNADGSLHTRFNGGGVSAIDFGYGDDRAYSIVMQPDGKLVIGGYSYDGAKWVFGLARFTSSGAYDLTFDADATVTTTLGNQESFVMSLALQSDGMIVACGSSSDGTGYRVTLARYGTSGALDSSFGSAGSVITSNASGDYYGTSVAIDSNGKIVVGGYSVVSSLGKFMIHRYETSGSIDSSFATNGIFEYQLAAGSDDRATAMKLQSDGKVLVAGSSESAGTKHVAVLRFAP
jgi:uncharacterized delta-60 repeat protein